MPIKIEKIKNILKPSKLIISLILFAVVFQALSFPLAASAVAKGEFPSLEPPSLNCWLNIGCYVKRFMAWVGYIILRVSTVFLWVASEIFNLSADISLDYKTYNRNTATAIYSGWKAARDFVNLFFIFVILILAIATILQIPGYGFKQIIFRLVFIAIFINFSFFITQQIIIATNSAAIFFKNSAEKDGRGLATIFAEGLNPQNIISGYAIPTKYIAESDFEDDIKICQKENMTEEEKAACKQATYERIDKKSAQMETAFKTNSEISIISIIITTIGGIIIVLTAAFILLAAAILFMIRTVILWVLMMLAPLAFFAYILPSTGRHWSAWWTRLLREAFFAPVMMFMFYIVVLIIDSEWMKTFAYHNPRKTINESFIFNYYLVAQYVFLLILLAICLMVARNMGATGASMAIDYGTRARRWAQGQAGRVPARFARRYAAPVAEKVATGEGGVAKTLRRIPGLGAGARAIVGSERQRVSDMEKQLGSLTTDEIKTRYESKWLKSREDLMAMTNTLKGRGDLGKLSPAQLKDVHGRMKGLGMDVKDIETHAPTLTAQNLPGSRTPQELQNIEKAVGNQRADQVKDYAKNTEQYRDADILANTQKLYGENHLREFGKAADVNDDAKASAKVFFESIATFGDTIDEIADKLELMGNSSAARFLKTSDGEKIFRDNIDTSISERITSKRNLEMGTNTQQQAVLGRMSVTDLNELDYSGLKSRMAAAGKNMDSLFDNMIKAFNPQQIRAIIDKGGQFSTDFMDKLERIGGAGMPTGRSDKATDIGTELDITYGRNDLRRWIEGNLGKDLLNLK